MKKRALIIAALAPVLVAGVIQVKSCKDDFSPDQAKLFLEMDGKTYGASTSAHMNPGQTSALDIISVFKDGDEVFVKPSDVGPVLDAMVGNITIVTKKEPTFAGYFSQGNDVFHTSHREIRTTATLGEQEQLGRVTIKGRSGEVMDIEWVFREKTGENECLSGCEVRSFWTWVMPAQGEQVLGREETLVVSVSKLATFAQATATYDRALKVLIVKPK